MSPAAFDPSAPAPSLPTDSVDAASFRASRAFRRLFEREAALVPGLTPEALFKLLPEDVRILARDDADYPSAFALLKDAPEVLVCEGDPTLLECEATVSIVGSRNASEARTASTFEAAQGLAERGFTVVSGLAAGIDRAAHEGALAARRPSGAVGRTAAVLGTPLAAPWPEENAELARRIARDGVLLSEAPQAAGLSFTPEARTASLHARNRLVAALGRGTLVMAAESGSSTLIEARAALALGKTVLIWHEAAGDSGARELLDEYRESPERVRVVASADEVAELLSPWQEVWWL
ncbi:DNA-processing protein DprA [Sutterella megalosphaeroides]|uniref:DNA-processing protein DprA n=1 Tax=Sutterella megalosphaeroides TaxID=2494234 RepID=UPI000E728532|nr:DNA-processing protein DprA [Sutterella megalosphaeroides]